MSFSKSGLNMIKFLSLEISIFTSTVPPCRVLQLNPYQSLNLCKYVYISYEQHVSTHNTGHTLYLVLS